MKTGGAVRQQRRRLPAKEDAMAHVIIEADPRIPPVPWPMGVILYVPSSIAHELLRCLNELAGAAGEKGKWRFTAPLADPDRVRKVGKVG
jgi:hypothetical protein